MQSSRTPRGGITGAKAAITLGSKITDFLPRTGPTASRIRLTKLLGMLGREHAGERDAVALAAHRIVVGSGLTWRQVIAPPPVEKRLPELGTWRVTVGECLARPGSLRPWEAGFLRDLPAFQRLCVKQRYCLKQIAEHVLGPDAG